MQELISMLTDCLNVEEQQAKGGAGLLFQLAKDRLGDEEFARLAQNIPNLQTMMQAAPETGGLVGALGGLASAFGGQVEGLGNLAVLMDGFSKLGIDQAKVMQFVPVVLSYVQNQGGDELKGLLERVLK